MTNFPEKLLAGYTNFKSGRLEKEATQYKELAEKGQAPETMIIVCSDSRSAPEAIFDSGPGELFVVRNVANLVPPYNPEGAYHSIPAALEFAVTALKVKNIVVMGHALCGGIKAALSEGGEPLTKDNFVGKWIAQLEETAETVKSQSELSDSEKQKKLEHSSVNKSVQNLRSFPFISALESENKLSVHGAWFDISSGDLWLMDEEKASFERAISS